MTFLELQTSLKNLISVSGTGQDTFLEQSLNDGQQDFSRDLNWPHSEYKKSLSAVANQYIYTLATDVDVMKAVTYKQKYVLRPVSYMQYLTLMENESLSTFPSWYCVHEGKLKIYPAISADAATTTLNAAVSSTTATTISLTSTDDLESKGRGLIDSEVVDWQYVDGTNDDIEVCTRGAEGTTAATHSNGATFTYQDIEYSYYKTLTDLSADGDTSSIPARYHEALVYYAAMKWYEKLGELDNANRMQKRYNEIKEQAKKDLGEKQEQQFNTVLDNSVNYRNMDNTYPDETGLSQEVTH